MVALEILLIVLLVAIFLRKKPVEINFKITVENTYPTPEVTETGAVGDPFKELTKDEMKVYAEGENLIQFINTILHGEEVKKQ